MYFSQSLAQAPLVCSGTLTQPGNMVWAESRVELLLDHSGKAQTTAVKSNISTLNAQLQVEPGDEFLLARESMPRPTGAEDRSLAISELKISRRTGAFTLSVSHFRNMDVSEGKSVWEGTCARRGSAEKKL